MKRLFSIFLSLLILLCCVVPVSATSFDPDSNGYTFDGLPYLTGTYFNTSEVSIGGIVSLMLSMPEKSNYIYIDGIVRTDDVNPRFSSSAGVFTVSSLGNNLFHFSGRFPDVVDRNFSIFYTKNNTSTYFEFLTFNVSPVDYVTNSLDMYFNMSGRYSYFSYNSPGSSPQYKTINTSFNETVTISSSGSVYTPLLHSNVTNGYFNSSYEYNENKVFTTSYLYFDWTSFNRVDFVFWNGYDELQDYVFYVDGVNVVKSIYPISLGEHSYSVVSLDFSDLDPKLFSNLCYLQMRGYETMNSSSTNEFFHVKKVSCFYRTVSNNFWPTWINRIFSKLDNIFTGRSQDQTAADSFNDSVADQSNELEDLTADLNSVTRPPLSDVNLSTSTMVDSGTIVLATSGIGSILSNTIILRVLLMALTFALAGFILFGKR